MSARRLYQSVSQGRLRPYTSAALGLPFLEDVIVADLAAVIADTNNKLGDTIQVETPLGFFFEGEIALEGNTTVRTIAGLKHRKPLSLVLTERPTVSHYRPNRVIEVDDPIDDAETGVWKTNTGDGTTPTAWIPTKRHVAYSTGGGTGSGVTQTDLDTQLDALAFDFELDDISETANFPAAKAGQYLHRTHNGFGWRVKRTVPATAANTPANWEHAPEHDYPRSSEGTLPQMYASDLWINEWKRTDVDPVEWYDHEGLDWIKRKDGHDLVSISQVQDLETRLTGLTHYVDFRKYGTRDGSGPDVSAAMLAEYELIAGRISTGQNLSLLTFFFGDLKYVMHGAKGLHIRQKYISLLGNGAEFLCQGIGAHGIVYDHDDTAANQQGNTARGIIVREATSHGIWSVANHYQKFWEMEAHDCGGDGFRTQGAVTAKSYGCKAVGNAGFGWHEMVYIKTYTGLVGTIPPVLCRANTSTEFVGQDNALGGIRLEESHATTLKDPHAEVNGGHADTNTDGKGIWLSSCLSCEINGIYTEIHTTDILIDDDRYQLDAGAITGYNRISLGTTGGQGLERPIVLPLGENLPHPTDPALMLTKPTAIDIRQNDTVIDGGRYGGHVDIAAGVTGTIIESGTRITGELRDNGVGTIDARLGYLADLVKTKSFGRDGATAGNNFTGFVDIAGTNTSAAVVFPTPEPTANYQAFFSVWRLSGPVNSGAFGARYAGASVNGFSVELDQAPGAGNTVRVRWMLVRI